MKIFRRLSDGIEEIDREGLRRSILTDNIRRGRVMAIVVILLEACLSASDITTGLLKVDERFHFTFYLIMYSIMILVNIVFIIGASRLKDMGSLTLKSVSRLETCLMAYIIFVISWGSIISLMDQALYGQLMVFMVNMIMCSMLFYMNNKQVLAAYLLPSVIVMGGLPFFQPSSDVLIGHYVNLAIFIVVSWLASRIMYLRYCSNHRRRLMLIETNKQLEIEIERNKSTNLLLSDANRQLRKLSLVDELTGLANRRSFRNYIDTMFASPMREGMLFSVVMIDLDCFKEYNDNYGHGEADLALVAVSAQIQSMVQHSMDIAARWGGEEFIYAAFEMDASDIESIAERIRKKVLDLQIPHQYSKAYSIVTISAGCSTIVIQDKSDISRCIELADKAMYKAKASGRNKIVCGANDVVA
jgi:diguanylate cyclase (GGDEF)-like protein